MVALLLLGACSREAAIDNTEIPAGDTVVVFTTVAGNIVAPLLDAYAARSASTIVLIDGDLQTLGEAEQSKDRPQPDLFIAGDVADLTRAAEQNVLRPTHSARISRRIPPELRDPEHLWTSFSARARTVVYNTRLTGEHELQSISDYGSLADESWRGRLCLSSSTVAGNGSLIARLINDLGIREAERVVRGWRANLARVVFADDTQLLRAVAAGDCAIGIADSSDIARMLKADRQANIAAHRFSAAGVTHIDLSGGGVTRHANNPEGAVSLLEWLTSRDANAIFSAARLEFPANPHSSTDAALEDWSGFKPGTINVAGLGYLLEDAIRLAERARYP